MEDDDHVSAYKSDGDSIRMDKQNTRWNYCKPTNRNGQQIISTYGAGETNNFGSIFDRKEISY